MTPPAPPGDPRRGSLGPDARRLLDDRNVMDAASADFAKNLHFDRLHGGNLDGPERPVVLFTACPHDLLARRASPAAVPDDIAKWAVSPPPVTVDGQKIPLIGTDRAAARPPSWNDLAAARSVLAVERGGPALHGGDIIMYRELHPGGFCEWGASSLFFGPNGRASTGLRLCYMAGELRVFLEHLAPLYTRIGLDGPFTVFLSIRNSNRLVLDTYGDESLDRPWDICGAGPPARTDPATGSANIQWWHDFGSAGELAGGGAAQAVGDMAARVCSEYNEADPGCCIGGAFPWLLWLHARDEALGGCRP